MENIIKAVLSQLSMQREKKDYFDIYLDNQVEFIIRRAKSFKNSRCKLMVYDMNNYLCLNEDYCISDKLKINKKLSNCKMIAISTEKSNFFTFFCMLKRIKEYCFNSNCHGAIFSIYLNEILLFPNIHYQDTYLLENIVSKQLLCEKINICFIGCRNNLVII